MLDIVQSRQDDIAIVALNGRLDTNTSTNLEQLLLNLLDKSQKKLLIDLAALEFISSSGLRVLLMIAKKLKSANGQMALSSMKNNVKEVFEIAGFTMLFSILSTKEQALESLR